LFGRKLGLRKSAVLGVISVSKDFWPFSVGIEWGIYLSKIGAMPYSPLISPTEVSDARHPSRPPPKIRRI
jgi:hypothetical protein